jgi:hypothetical protein
MCSCCHLIFLISQKILSSDFGAGSNQGCKQYIRSNQRRY